jgi:hypothetical protein
MVSHEAHVRSLALFPLLLVACSGAPFTVAEQTTQDAPADAPTVSLPIEASTPEAGASAPEASPLPDVAPDPVEASAPDVSPPPPPGTLCCRLPGPGNGNTADNCSGVGPLTSYPCGTALGGWIYSVSTTDADGKIHVADVDCTYGPPTTADIGLGCRWGQGTAPSTANCGASGAIEECQQ